MKESYSTDLMKTHSQLDEVLMIFTNWCFTILNIFEDVNVLCQQCENSKSWHFKTFFLIAVIFLIFYVELVIIMPMILIMSSLNVIDIYIIMLIFLIILTLGLYHEWYNNMLDWV